MAKKKASAETRKAQIIDAAMQCFQHKGYENTTMDDIAAKYGLSKGSIYFYYPSKRDILIAVFDHLILKMFNRYESLLHSDAPAKQKLIQMGQAVVDTLLRDYKVYRPIMVLWSVAYEDESLREIGAELYKQGNQLLQEFLHQAEKESGIIIKNKQAMSALMIAMGEGLFTRQVLMNDLPVDEIEEEMKDVIERILTFPEKERVESKDSGANKQIVLNELIQTSGSEWKNVNDDYVEWQASDVTLRVALPKGKKERKSGKGKRK